MRTIFARKYLRLHAAKIGAVNAKNKNFCRLLYIWKIVKGESGMVSEKKVHLMTQIALDETKRCKRAIMEGGYYKSDYVRSRTISAIWNVTVSYLLVLFLFALYHADYIFVNVVRLDYEMIGFAVFGIYIGLFVPTVFFSYFYYRKKYARNSIALREYYKKLKELDEFYSQSREEAEDDTVTGA